MSGGDSYLSICENLTKRSCDNAARYCPLRVEAARQLRGSCKASARKLRHAYNHVKDMPVKHWTFACYDFIYRNRAIFLMGLLIVRATDPL
jgi:hypothetical protein